MIIGIGTDLCDIRRVQLALDRRGERFAQKVLGEREYAVYTQRRSRVAVRGLRYLATRFAAKEAFSKAVGLGIRHPMTWRRCEILNASSGKPQIVLDGLLAQWFDARGWHAHVTVTDEGDYACAFVVVEVAKAVEADRDATATSSTSSPPDQAR
jgi:holo-[acyl-carrier protein] synthase